MSKSRKLVSSRWLQPLDMASSFSDSTSFWNTTVPTLSYCPLLQLVGCRTIPRQAGLLSTSKSMSHITTYRTFSSWLLVALQSSHCMPQPGSIIIFASITRLTPVMISSRLGFLFRPSSLALHRGACKMMLPVGAKP